MVHTPLALLLGFVQGLTEFLPISSSAHLVLIPWLLRLPDPGLAFDVALHLGTLIAVLFVFGKEWWTLALAGLGLRPDVAGRKMFWMLAAASVPGVIAGALLEDAAATVFRSPLLIALALAVAGAFLVVADYAAKQKTRADLGWTGAVLVGCAQALAIIPGVSRSGATMTAGLFLGLSRAEAARFSFLLSAPITAGAALLALRHLTGADLTPAFFAGIAVAAVTGIWAIRFLLRFLERNTFVSFAIYRLALALAVVVLYFSRR